MVENAVIVNGINNIWLYWENAGGNITPSCIELSHETIYRTIKDAQIHLVTPDNISHYLPDFNKEIQIFVNKIIKPSIALKTDYIRVLLLEKYGGLWLDSDIIVLKDLGEQVLTFLREKEFICIKKQNGHISNNFMASVPHGKIISEYKIKIEEELKNHDKFHWNQLGHSLLTPIAGKYIDTVHFIDEKRIHPVSFEKSEILFQNTLLAKIGDLVREDTLVVMYYHSLFDSTLRNYAKFRYWSKEKILNEDILISAVFRSVLKQDYEILKLDLNIPENYYSEIGLIIPTIERPDCLSEFLVSIQKYLPGISIYIAVQGENDKSSYEILATGHNVKLFFVPYDFGLAACRNFLIKKVNEPYILLCDDDFIFTERTDLKVALKLLKSYPDIKIAGGMVLNYYYDRKNTFLRKAYTSFCNIILTSNRISNKEPVFVPVEYLNLKRHYIDAEIYFQYCDSVNNFALIDKSIFYDHELWWDDQFKIMGEHEDFYLRCKQLNRFKIVYTNSLIVEHHRKTNSEYNEIRSRNDGQINLLKKWNLSSLIVLGKRIDRIFKNEYSRIPFILNDVKIESGKTGNELINQTATANIINNDTEDQTVIKNLIKDRTEKIIKLKSEIQSIFSSISWRLSYPLRSIYGYLKHSSNAKRN